MNPTIIYEDKQFLVVNKPPGLIVHHARHAGTANARRAVARVDEKPQPALTDWLLENYPEVAGVGDDPAQRPGIVHRLDKETSGVLLVARTQASFEYLKGLFQKHEIQKTYLAWVSGQPKKEKGIIDVPIGIRNGTTKRSTRSTKMAKPAVTEYKVLKTEEKIDARGQGAKFSLLEVKPQTGRTHQIRVHLASIGYPVVGDHLYGPKAQPAWATRLMLHALSIEFTAANGKRVKFEAEQPF